MIQPISPRDRSESVAAETTLASWPALREPAISRRTDAEATTDFVGSYLREIATIPLLSRPQEIDLAQRIERHRRDFRRCLLECDFVLQAAIELLRQVHAGEAALDRIVQVSVSHRLEKHHILGRLPHHLDTLHHLQQRNHEDYARVQTLTDSATAAPVWRRLRRRRRRAVRLVEELGVRAGTSRALPGLACATGDIGTGVEPDRRRSIQAETIDDRARGCRMDGTAPSGPAARHRGDVAQA